MIEVSIIVPIYNSEKYIYNLLKNLNQQTFFNCEFILVNDGSTDNTKTIIEKYIHNFKDRRFRLISQKNSGVSVARNTGIKNSKGKYIIFVDSDDSFDKNFVRNYLMKIKKNNTDIEFFPTLKLDDDERVIGSISYDKSSGNKFLTPKEFILLFSDLKAWGYPFCYISKAELWKNIRFNPNISFQEDVLVLFDLFVSYPNIKIHINDTGYYYYYYIHKNSALRSMNIDDLWEFVQVDNYILKMVKNSDSLKETFSYLLGLKLSSLLLLINASLKYNDNINYNHARSEFILIYPKVRIISFKIKIKRFIQYFMLKLNMKKTITWIYQSLD